MGEPENTSMTTPHPIRRACEIVGVAVEMDELGDITDECGIVSHEEAREIQCRYNASHFRKHPDSGEYARYSIPADPTRDDDLRLIAYITQSEARDATLTRLRDLLGVASDDEIVGAVEAMVRDDPEMGLCCYGCGLPYSSQAWADISVPDEFWKMISPSRDDGGVLCFNCMNASFARLGLRNVPHQISSGPFCFMSRDVTGQSTEATMPAEQAAKERSDG